MTSTIPSPTHQSDSGNDLVEMAWDPITRIVGSLGIYTKIDFKQKEVVECHSTSSIFRGYSVFMKGKDPRDAHFITSRICGICGDNHATCSCYAQNMAYGVRPPHLAEWIINLGEAAEYMFDHNIFQENLVGVDYCEKMIAETNPGVLELANTTESPHAGEHGYRTIGDIMRSLNPFTGEFYREALVVSRYTREMFCLMEGRHVHPSTLYPGGVGTVATIQLMTDYMTRLMRYIEHCKKVVPMHDDLFDFMYQALPGYEQSGLRRTLLGCWGAFQDPEHCNFEYKDMTDWGRKMFVTPGVVVDGKLVTTDLVDINLGIRIMLGSSFYDDWEDQEMFVKNDPLGNPVDRRHPGTSRRTRGRRSATSTTSTAGSCRRAGSTARTIWPSTPVADRLARLWTTALANLVDIGYVQATGQQRQDQPSEDGPQRTGRAGVEDPAVEQHDRAQPRSHLLPSVCSGGRAPLRREGAGRDSRRAHQDLGAVRGPRRGRRMRLHRGSARSPVPPHGDQGRQDRQLPPLPADSVERESTRLLRHPWPLRGRHPGPADLRGKRS
ncbi:MAG: nickel-dependent hydrogenase large subunit [Nocardioidaceae bacterium]